VTVVAEEAVSAEGLPPVGDVFFLVDPLDGTREFVEGRGEFTINIALIERGNPVFGVVYAPVLSRLYMTLGPNRACAAKLAPSAPALSLADCGLHDIRARNARPEGLTALASRSHNSPETAEWLSRYRIAECRQAGSSLKFCVIAEGEADIYPRFGPTAEWDTAAGHAVLLAAGGRVTTVDGAPLTYGKAEQRFLNPNFIAWGCGDFRAAEA